MDRATGIFNVVLSRAANVPRNYIIDQTNVYKSARKRKLKPFADYQKVTIYLLVCCSLEVKLFMDYNIIFCPFQIAVVVFPKPEELKIRSSKRFKEMGKEVPPDAVNDMIGVFDFLFLSSTCYLLVLS